MAAHTGGRDERASTKLPRQLSRGRPQCVLGAPLLSGLNEVASAVKPRLEESLGRVASWRQASTKLPRQLSRGRDRLGASAERRVAASTKLPRQLSRGSLHHPRVRGHVLSLNEVASAVKPRRGPPMGAATPPWSLNEVASAVKPRPSTGFSNIDISFIASTKLPRQLSRGLKIFRYYSPYCCLPQRSCLGS